MSPIPKTFLNGHFDILQSICSMLYKFGSIKTKMKMRFINVNRPKYKKE